MYSRVTILVCNTRSRCIHVHAGIPLIEVHVRGLCFISLDIQRERKTVAPVPTKTALFADTRQIIV